MKIIRIAMPMKTDDDLGEDCWLQVDDVSFEEDGELGFLIHCRYPGKNYNIELGNLFISKTNSLDPRWENTYYVTDANAEHGWGPFLYDKALKYLSSRGKYLISNYEATMRRIDLYGGGTSYEASQVWKFYDEKRDDVVKDRQGYRINEDYQDSTN